MNYVDYIIVGLFLGMTFFIGAYFYFWVKSGDDFYVAGRQITPFILASVIVVTNVNLFSFVGQSGIAYKQGISIIWQPWTGNMALVFAGLFIVPIYRRLRIRTIPELLERRYGKGIRTMVAVLWIFRLSFWLGIVLYTGVVAAQAITGNPSFTFWVLVIGGIAIVYTALGGMFAVAFTDVIQFILMLLGALIVLPLAMSLVDWWPGLMAQLPSDFMILVRNTGEFDWKFILAIFFLGLEWATVDQGLLQRTFSADSTKTAARGLVLAGIITTPFALLWLIPGMAASIIHPGLANPDSAVPTLLRSLLPHGILGLVICGLLSAQLSTIAGNLNGVATMITSDIYESIFNKRADNKIILLVARFMTFAVGIGMILFAYWVPKMGGAVNAYLTLIAIMDMPLFIIAVVYGLFWKRCNWQGAIAGYLAGAAAGIIGEFFLQYSFNQNTFLTAAVALVVTPIVSGLTRRPDEHKIAEVWQAKHVTEEEVKAGQVYNIIPVTTFGKASLAVLFVGLSLFIIGIVVGNYDTTVASYLAVTGMIVYFIGGLSRTMAD